MNFEEILRQKIGSTKSKVARSVLKVALGEFQQKNAAGKATEQDGFSIVEKIINGNRETLALLKQEDPRRVDLEEEIAILSSLLPAYLTTEEVLERVRADAKLFAEVNTVLSQGDKTRPLEDAANAKLIGRTTGAVVKFFKSGNIAVKGDTVKEALSRLFHE